MAEGSTDKTTLWFIIGFVAIVVVGLLILGAMSGSTSPNANSNFVSTTAPAISAKDWTQGSSTAPVSLVEYGDFECPACGAYYPIVKQVLANYPGKIYFAFRNFPLYQIHPVAGISAQAAEAAGLQGKYWEMFDLLYQNQTTWSASTPDAVVKQFFVGYATSLGMDVNKFQSDITSSAVLNKIQSDVTSGNTAQIDHTPTFFVNSKQIPNPASYAEFKSVIDAAIASSTTG